MADNRLIKLEEKMEKLEEDLKKIKDDANFDYHTLCDEIDELSRLIEKNRKLVKINRNDIVELKKKEGSNFIGLRGIVSEIFDTNYCIVQFLFHNGELAKFLTDFLVLIISYRTRLVLKIYLNLSF